LVPFVFVLDPQGIGLLLKLPKDGSWIDIVLITAKATLGLAALAAAAQGWALRKATLIERLLLALAGVFFVFSSLLEAGVQVRVGRCHHFNPDFCFPVRRSGPAKTIHDDGTRSSDRPALGGPPNETQRTYDLRARHGCSGDDRRGVRPGSRSGAQYRHRDRRHRRRLLSARRRHGQRAVQI